MTIIDIVLHEFYVCYLLFTFAFALERLLHIFRNRHIPRMCHGQIHFLVATLENYIETKLYKI